LSIRNRLTALTAVMAALAVAAPVAGASAQGTPATVAPSSIPCYPYPAFCGPNGQPWFPLLGRLFNLPGTLHTVGWPFA
jgi:hypothetical protein